MSSPVGKTVVLLSLTMGQYLRYPVEDTPGHGFPVFNNHGHPPRNLLSPYAKFEMVASTISSSCVHIRTMYNNKYLVRSTNDNYWIWAGADEINEDKSSWTCTLFEILNIDKKPNYIRIRHVQLGHYLYEWSASAFYANGLYAVSSDIDTVEDRDQFEWTDVGCFFVLPKFLSFKNSSGALLGAKLIDNVYKLLPFSSKNIEDKTVMHQSEFQNSTLRYCIKSSYFGYYWKTSADGWHSAWIEASGIDPQRSAGECYFWVYEAGENDAAVIQTYNDKFYCKEHTSGNKINCLYGLDTFTFEEAKLQVVETISKRSIYGVKYRPESDARYYDKNKVLLTNEPAINTNSQPITMSFTLSYPVSTSNIWNSPYCRKVFRKVNLEAELPQILNAKEKTISQQYNWGEVFTTTTHNATFSVTVPPNSTININFYANYTSADIPFIYSQDDILLNGNKVTTLFEDGLFTVINFVDFSYEIA